MSFRLGRSTPAPFNAIVLENSFLTRTRAARKRFIRLTADKCYTERRSARRNRRFARRSSCKIDYQMINESVRRARIIARLSEVICLLLAIELRGDLTGVEKLINLNSRECSRCNIFAATCIFISPPRDTRTKIRMDMYTHADTHVQPSVPDAFALKGDDVGNRTYSLLTRVSSSVCSHFSL